jgi:hypothetical protein
MKYTVVYQPSALEELADLWLRAPDRQTVTNAANRIEQLLRIDADKRGEPYDDDRVLIEKPLAAVFTVSPDDCLVTLLKFLWVD